MFFSDGMIQSFLQNARIKYDHINTTIAAYLLQKSYNESRIDRVEKIDELLQQSVQISDIKINRLMYSK